MKKIIDEIINEKPFGVVGKAMNLAKKETAIGMLNCFSDLIDKPYPKEIENFTDLRMFYSINLQKQLKRLEK